VGRRVVLVVLLGLLAGRDAGEAAAPPLPSGKLNWAQRWRLSALKSRAQRAAEAGKFAEALRLARESVALRRRWQGVRHWEAGNAGLEVQRWQRLLRLSPGQQKEVGQSIRRERAGAEYHARGRYHDAEKAYREALAIRCKVLGEEHPETAQSYSYVAMCLDAQGQHADALPLFRQALAIYRKVLGEEHPDTAQSYNNLAYCLHHQGKPAEAVPLYRQALAIWRRVLGEEHPRTADSYNNLALCLHHQGKHMDALPLLRKALAIRRSMLGEEHPDTAQSYNEMASCLHAQGKPHQAIRCWQAALLGADSGRLASASSGFERSLFRAWVLTPRAALAVAHARLSEPQIGWQYAEVDLGRALLDDLGGSPDRPDQGLRAQLRELEARLLPLLALGKLSADQKRLREELLPGHRPGQVRAGSGHAQDSPRRPAMDPAEAARGELPCPRRSPGRALLEGADTVYSWRPARAEAATE
jgi:tetratricopeptide (TPR) repeat protein